MTSLQLAALTAIEAYTDANGYPPSLTDIGMAIGVSARSGAHRVVARLRDMGLVEWDDRQARSIRVVRKQPVPAVVSAAHLLCEQTLAEQTIPSEAAIAQSLADAMGRGA